MGSMEKGNKSGNFIQTGISTLLVIFTVVVMAVFALGTLMTSRNNDLLAQKTADYKTSYYNADGEGQEILKQIDEILQVCYNSSDSEEDYYIMAEEKLKSLTVPEGSLQISGDHRVSWSAAVSEDQQLLMAIEIRYPLDAEDYYYEVTQWQTVTGEQTYDNSLKLFQPGGEE